jgi:hypothetical protein
MRGGRRDVANSETRGAMKRPTLTGLAPQANPPARSSAPPRPSGFYSISAPRNAEIEYKATRPAKPKRTGTAHALPGNERR